MCPLCVANAVWVVAGVTSGGGLAAWLAGKLSKTIGLAKTKNENTNIGKRRRNETSEKLSRKPNGLLPGKTC
jgi:hypothetical protein